MTDRLVGALGVILALAYGMVGTGFEAGVMGDPLGARTFPVMLAIALGIFSLLLLARPRGGADWPSAEVWVRKLAAIAAMIIYGLVLETLGFVVASFLLVAVLVLLMSGRLAQAVTTGVAASLLLYGVFDQFLGLPLPVGSIFAGLLAS